MCDINPVHHLLAAGTLEVCVYVSRTDVHVPVSVLCINERVCL